MYIIKALAEQAVNLLVGGNLRFRVEGLPGGLDVVKMALGYTFWLDRSTAHDDAFSVAEQYGMITNIEMDAYGQNLIHLLSAEELAALASLAGEGADVGAVGSAITDAVGTFKVLWPFYDRRMDEKGSAFDMVQDSSLLLQGGTIDLTIPAITGKDWNAATANFFVEFYCQPRTGVYARPYKRAYKVHQAALTGGRLERGVMMDILAHGNATRLAGTGFDDDQNCRVTAEYAGVIFKQNLRAHNQNQFEQSAVEGIAALTTTADLVATGFWQDTIIVHMTHNELGEISKFRRSPNAEGRIDVTPGAVAPIAAATAMDCIYTELKPAGREHLLRCAQTYDIPADQAISVLGPDADPWMPKQLA